MSTAKPHPGHLPRSPPPLLSGLEREPGSLRLNRTRWGLAVRGERTVRAVLAPLQQGEVMAPQLANHVKHIDEVCGHLLATLSRDATAFPDLCPPRLLLPLLQLLSSHTATLAKAVHCNGRLLAGLCEHVRTIKLLFLTQPSSRHHHAALLAATAPLVVALLLPRCAAISAAAFASLQGDCVLQPAAGSVLSSLAGVCTKLPPGLSLLVLSSGHMWTLVLRAVEEVRTFRQGRSLFTFHKAFRILAEYARLVACLVQHLSKEGCEGAPPGSPELRVLLAQPLLQLLGSPLLDLLAYAPHLLVWEEDAALTHCQYRLNCLTTLLMPAGTDRSHTTMAQVRLTLEFIYKLLSICVSRYWSV